MKKKEDKNEKDEKMLFIIEFTYLITIDTMVVGHAEYRIQE